MTKFSGKNDPLAKMTSQKNWPKYFYFENPEIINSYKNSPLQKFSGKNY